MTDGGDGWAPVDNSDQDPADDLGEPKEKIMKKELNDILEIGTTNGEKADKTEENEKEHKEMEKKENGVEKTDKPSTENKESDNGSDEKKPESESKSPEMPDEEDDIPLDLILKEEQIEVIANGTMATDEKDPKDESCAFEHCGLCHNRVILGHAKLLGCLHTFCTTCLDKQEMQRTSADGSATKVLCPVCRCLTPRSLLAENHFVKNDEDKDEVQSKEAKKVCVSCEDEGEIEAEKYCLDCNEWLCAECVAAHKRVKLTKGHTLSDEPPKITRDKSESYCPEHPTEPLQLFCDSCDTLTCRDCQLQKHRDHRYDYVKEAAARERHMLVNAQPSLLAKQAALVEFQKIASERLVQLEQREDLLTNEIDSYIGEIIAAIKQKQEEFHKTVGAVIGERKKEVNGQLNTSKKLLKAINHSQNFVKYIDDPSKTRGLLCARKLVKDYFNLIIREPTPTMTTLAHCNVNVTFNKNNNLIHSLVSNQLASVHFEQPVRPPPGQHPKHLPQMMGARPHSRSHMQRAHRPPQNPGSQMLRPNSSIPTQVQQITSLQRQQRQAAAAAHLAQNGHQRISPQSIHHQNHRNQFYPGHPMPPSHAGPSGHPQPTPPQAPSPHQIRNSPVMSPNFIPGRPHSTDSGHSSDVARQPAATPPIVSSLKRPRSEENPIDGFLDPILPFF